MNPISPGAGTACPQITTGDEPSPPRDKSLVIKDSIFGFMGGPYDLQLHGYGLAARSSLSAIAREVSQIRAFRLAAMERLIKKEAWRFSNEPVETFVPLGSAPFVTNLAQDMLPKNRRFARLLPLLT